MTSVRAAEGPNADLTLFHQKAFAPYKIATLIDTATNNTPIELEFGYVIDADHSLIFTAHEVYLPKPKLAVTGPGGVQASFNWQAAKPSVGQMLTVALTNDVEDYA